ncbi:MAG: carotenoid oxygenase family protein [Myxococcota bacterium]
MAEAIDSELPFYLRGIHAPVEHEVEAFDLKIEGSLPPEINGNFLRNGPNPLNGDPGHWFLGDGMLHGIALQGGRALSYRNRFVQTRHLAGEAQWLADPANPDFTAGVANTHVIEHAGKILALVENGFPWEVDRDLNTVGYHDFGGKLKGAMTAHPKICPKTGEMHFFGYHFAPPFCTYHRVSAEGVLLDSIPIEIPRPVMMHDFAITEEHIIFMDLPIVFDAERAMSGRMPYQFQPEAGARLGVLRRDDLQGQVEWFEIGPCYVFHPMNAWTEGQTISLDVARYASLWSKDAGHFDEAQLHRFEIHLDEGRVSERPLDDLSIEFPRIKEDLNGSQNRYGYAAYTEEGDGITGGGLVRYDLKSGKRELFDGKGQYVPSEAVFVPAADDPSEEAGWLLSYVYDKAREKSDLAVFDATSLAQGPIASVELPQRVPMGFHGSWIPAA